MVSFLTGADAAAQGGLFGGSSLIIGIVWLVLIIAMFYFLAIRPQKKQQKKQDALMASIECGDSVLTTSGFYGVVIDVMDEVIVVEFGNNKNCRIPMKKTAVVEVEKVVKEEPEKKD